jgi:hypothetical protein
MQLLPFHCAAWRSLTNLVLATVLFGSSAFAASVTLRPTKDTTIYGSGDAALSNGAGRFLFAGSSGNNVGGNRVLRSLVAFDLAGQIPAGSTINSVTLNFTIDTPLPANTNTVRLHRVTADWGEGTSVGSGVGEGIGAPATTNDATWNHRFFNTSTWTTPGGDFSATVSASQLLNGRPGNAAFTTPALAADVQAWVNNPASNFGWLLRAEDESGPALRFSSRQGPSAPTLVIDFTAGTGPVNVAPTITSQPVNQTVAAGSSATLTVTATGTPAPTYQWRRDNVAISGATNATLALGNVTAANAGSYTVVVTNAAGSVTSNAATVTVTTTPPPPAGGAITARLSNLSVRAAMSAGQTLIVGFSVSGGSGGRSVLVRGVGPTLAGFGLSGAMTDPRLQLFADGTLVTQNDNWGNSATLSTAFAGVGAFPLLANSNDAAFLQTVEGTRSVHLTGSGAGVALVELYDTGTGNSPRLVNVSTRNQVGTGDNILIFGFFVDGTGSKNVLIRAVGPTLGNLGVSGVLVDPRFDVFAAGSATAVASNDNWDASLASTFAAVGAFALTSGSRDAALVTSLAPGSYTVQVSGVNNGTGEALVEIYEVP